MTVLVLKATLYVPFGHVNVSLSASCDKLTKKSIVQL